MTEAAAPGALPGWLAYLHPLWMLASLALCLLALRLGLAIRRARRARRPPPRDTRARHLRIAKPAVVLVLVGFVLGPVSVLLLRDWTPMSSFHALLGGVAAVLFTGAGLQGLRLARGEQRARAAHAWLAGAAIALSLLAAVAGFVLVP